MIPSGAVVMVSGTISEGPLVDIIWRGQPVLMFTRDLLARGTPIQTANA